MCSYQDINYTIVIEEQSPLGFNQGFIVGPFSHRGSGRVNQRIISGLVMRKNYSLSVIVNTSVGNSKTKTYFGKPYPPSLSLSLSLSLSCMSHMYLKTTLCLNKSALGECATYIVVVKPSLSGFDVTVWLQHLVLVPQMCSDRP